MSRNKDVLTDGSDPLSRFSLPAKRLSVKPAVLTKKGLGSGFWHDIIAELMHLEATTAYWALQAANPTELDLQDFQVKIDPSRNIRIAGELASEELMICLECSHQYYARGTITVSPCDACGCQYFSMVSAH
jgi:hypothetical protein